ncbi:restriction endonuclease subunit S [Plesiomonas shigelloides]|uniref:restriction endonuclease subunit S n=1 Tax=Plesiomonas shigelloides TaxID=703 RepID=UPI0022468EB9|nr:restriction endonuclease subunit S [Plesiomonas shigelloides]MCX2534839.1 restriction endonuclease subunit S [Plesiomonas shigelloides]
MERESMNIPHHWECKTLVECTSNRNISYGIVQPGQHDDNGIGIIRVNNFENGRLNTSDVLKVSPSIEAKFTKTRLNGGEVLLTLVGSTGQSAVVPSELKGWNVPRAVAVIRPSEAVSAEWINICLQSSHTKHFLDARANTTVQKTLNLKDVKDIPIPLPPIVERQRLEDIVVSLEHKITLNRQINQTLEHMAQALFKSWFVDFDPVVDNALDAGFFEQNSDLPEALLRRAEQRKAVRQRHDFKPLTAETRQLFPTAFEECEEPSLGLGGWVPKGWKNIAIYSLAEFINGAAYKAFEPNLDKRGLPIIKIAELKAGVTDQTAFSDKSMPEKYRLTTGDILFSWSGNPDTSIDTFVWTYGEAWLNQHIFKVTPPDIIGERSFVLIALKSLKPIFAETARNKQTTGLGHVTVADLKRLQIIKPEPNVLAAWDHLVSPYVNQILALTLQAQTLAQLRDTLLPKLISGELRLSDDGTLASGNTDC